MSKLAEALSAAEWIRVLTPEQRRRVETDTFARTVSEGGFVCHKGQPANHWIGVIDGLIKIATVSRSGKLATFSGVPSGGWFGEGSLLRDEPRRYDGIALRDSQIAYVPRATFLWLLDTSTQFSRFVLVMLNERLGQAMGIMEYDRLLGPEGRIARCLASLFNPTLYPGIGSALQISQEEIGHLVGLSRSCVNQSLKLLQDKDLLRIERVGITILDLDRLRNFEE